MEYGQHIVDLICKYLVYLVHVFGFGLQIINKKYFEPLPLLHSWKTQTFSLFLLLSYCCTHSYFSWPYVGNLSFLVSLDLRNNSFSGILPHEISRLHGYNLLYGPIPMNLGSLKHLQLLLLGGNQLIGEHGANELRFVSSIFNSSSLTLWVWKTIL